MIRFPFPAVLTAAFLFLIGTAQAAGWTAAERANRLKQLAGDLQAGKSLPAHSAAEACYKEGQKGNERAIRAGLIVINSALIAHEMSQQAASASSEGPAAAVKQRRAFLATPRGRQARQMLEQFNEANSICTGYLTP